MIKFRSHKLQRDFRKNGFVVIPSFWNRQTLEAASVFFAGLEQVDLSFYTSQWVNDAAYKKKVNNFLKPMLDEAAANILNNFRSVYSYYLIKKQNSPESKVHIHQDWTLVDESRFWGINIWIPLVDITTENGSFCVVPYSHRAIGNIRGTNIDMPYGAFGSQWEKSHTKPLYVKAGDAILFDHRLVHFSPPNISPKDRIAVGHVLVPEQAPLLHFSNKNGTYLCKVVPDDFLIQYSFGDDYETFSEELPVLKDVRANKKLTPEKLRAKLNFFELLSRF